MTPEEAQAILASHRPGEGDPGRKELREALDLVAALPELKAWWEQEQAFDRAFAKKVASVEPPSDLKAAIVRGGATIIMARRLIDDSTEEKKPKRKKANDNDEKIVPFSEDDPFAEKVTDAKPRKGKGVWTRRLWALSTAATVMIGFLAITLFIKPQKLTGDDLPTLTREMGYLVAGGSPPQWPSQNLDEINTYLGKNQSPQAATLPVRVGSARPVGGSVEEWHKHHVTHLFLQSNQELIHLFIVSQAEFPDEKVNAEPDVRKQDAFTVRVWAEGDRIYLMLSRN